MILKRQNGVKELRDNGSQRGATLLVGNVCTEKSKMSADTYARPFTDYPLCDGSS